jgi:type I restriction enzyme, R subunit
MPEAGYTPVAAEEIRREADRFEKVCQEVNIANGGDVDVKSFEPSMRHLLNAYIHAGESKSMSAFDELGLDEDGSPRRRSFRRASAKTKQRL